MNNELHVILGATGSVGQSVIQELQVRQCRIRAVERRKKIEGIETVNADLMDENQTIMALQDAKYVYLCIGLKYDIKIWKEQWPKIMNNVINACEKVKAKLIFLDNIYMYGPKPLQVPIKESHPQIPTSEKGKIRKEIADMVMNAVNEGRIQALIGRSADFYGASINSTIYVAFLENMLKGKAPQSFSKLNVKHTYSYVGDNGKALVALALDDTTYGQVWHLPVSHPVTVYEINEIFNSILGTKYKISMIPRFILPLLGLFMPVVKEVGEMLYQFDEPYVISYEKFMNHFPDFEVTKLEDGLKEMVETLRKV